jgi:Cu(I)/Ag(I) efflux system protein CusF
MTAIQKFLAISALAMGAAIPLTGLAQSNMDHSKMTMPQAASMATGEVRKIDKDSAKITIKHGEIKQMDMPPMTMVFTAKDKTLLDGVKVGDKIQFMVVNESGKMVVTDIQAAK